MLNYSKLILTRVSFNYALFKKELHKAIESVNKEELILLRNWCLLMFGTSYGHLIVEAFKNAGLN